MIDRDSTFAFGGVSAERATKFSLLLWMIAALTVNDKKDQDKRCRLCGQLKPLTFEHVPPRSCYNEHGVRLRRLQDQAEHPYPRKLNRGLGTRAFCASCNNGPANLYVSAYRNAVDQVRPALSKCHPNEMVLLAPRLQSGWFGRQALLMCLAAAQGWTVGHDDYNRLRGIVLSPNIIAGLGDLRLVMYLMRDGEPRLNGFSGGLHVAGETVVLVHAEVAFPPFGFVLLEGDHRGMRAIRRLGLCDANMLFDRPPTAWCDEIFRLRMLTPIGSASLQYCETGNPETWF